MKTSLQNKTGRKNKKIWLIVFVAVIVAGAFSNSIRFLVSKTVVTAISPFFRSANYFGGAIYDFSYFIKSKKSLFDEVGRLKARNAELEKEFLMAEPMRKENEELKALFSQTNKKDYILGSIISRPPKAPYDIIVVDAGLESGAKEGMRALAYPGVMIGTVAEVFPKTSKIKLISFSGEETNVFLEEEKVSALAVGLGGGNLEIKMPSSFKINSGGKILTEGTFPLLVGEVGKIEVDLLNPFQKILFRLPVNLNEIKSVLVEK